MTTTSYRGYRSGLGHWAREIRLGAEIMTLCHVRTARPEPNAVDNMSHPRAADRQNKFEIGLEFRKLRAYVYVHRATAIMPRPATMESIMSLEITRAGQTFDFAKLPQASAAAMLGRGLTHYLGSELSSKVIGWSKRFEKENSREPNDAERDAYRSEALAAMVAALEAGTVGTVTRGAAVDPIEAEMEKLARADINAIIKANGLKWTGKGEERVVTFADGQTRTMDAMVEKRLADKGDEYRKAAEKNIRAKQKALEAKKGEADTLI